MLFRSVDGRIAGKGTEFFHKEDEHWYDKKEREIRFPEYTKVASEVKTWFMSPEELAAKYGK